MRKLIDTIKNIWNIEDLRNRILTTLGILAIYRLGCFVVIPGVDPAQLSALQDQTSDGLLGLLNMFTGGAFSQASIFALGIMPYISASIVIQLLGMAIPYFQKLQREGESGRKKINNITSYLTIVITGVQAPAYIANLRGTLPPEAFLLGSGFFFTIMSIIILVTGTLFVMWLGEKITDDILSGCHQCNEKCDEHTNCKNDACHILFIQCKECEKELNGCCSEDCEHVASLPLIEQKKLRKDRVWDTNKNVLL